MDTSDIGTSNRGRGRRGAATPVQPKTPGIVVLGPRDSLVGTLSVDGDVRIEGSLEGEVSATGEIAVQSTGTARAQIAARDIVINGTVDGSAVAQELMSIGDSAIVTGEVRSARLRVDEGANVNATISMSASDAPPARRSHDEPDESTIDVTGSAAGHDGEHEGEATAYAEVASGDEGSSDSAG
ncbi:MAG TPA: polymer-forming cytoskeletal protein [Candidatus Dormibacteraeota bacterium]